MLTHGPYEILRHLKGARHFPRDQRLRLETPDWRVLCFDGNPFSDDEVEGVHDESNAADPILPVLARVSALMEILRLGGSYEFVERLWSLFMPTSKQVDIEVSWSRNEVLGSPRKYT